MRHVVIVAVICLMGCQRPAAQHQTEDQGPAPSAQGPDRGPSGQHPSSDDTATSAEPEPHPAGEASMMAPLGDEFSPASSREGDEADTAEPTSDDPTDSEGELVSPTVLRSLEGEDTRLHLSQPMEGGCTFYSDGQPLFIGGSVWDAAARPFGVVRTRGGIVELRSNATGGRRALDSGTTFVSSDDLRVEIHHAEEQGASDGTEQVEWHAQLVVTAGDESVIYEGRYACGV